MNPDVPKQFLVCQKCRRLILDEAYTTSVSKRKLTVRRRGKTGQGMHKACAEAWVAEVQINPWTKTGPNSDHYDPEVEQARRNLEAALRLLEGAQNSVYQFEWELTGAIRSYHLRQREQLKNGLKVIQGGRGNK